MSEIPKRESCRGRNRWDLVFEGLFEQVVRQMGGPVEVETPQLGRVMFARPSESFAALNYLLMAKAQLSGVATTGVITIGHDRGLWSRRGCC